MKILVTDLKAIRKETIDFKTLTDLKKFLIKENTSFIINYDDDEKIIELIEKNDYID